MIEFSAVGDIDLYKLLAKAGPDQIRKAIHDGMEQTGRMVEAQAKNNNGARPGPFVQTGRLRSSITHLVSPDSMSVAIGTNVSYGPRLELGYQGAETVKAHKRKITQAWGKPIAGGSREIQVRGFERNAKTPAYPYLGPAFNYAVKINMLEDLVTSALNKILGAK